MQTHGRSSTEEMFQKWHFTPEARSLLPPSETTTTSTKNKLDQPATSSFNETWVKETVNKYLNKYINKFMNMYRYMYININI